MEKLTLSSNEFASLAPNTFRKLLCDQDFTDVTLATADFKQIKAHKVILSSCSEFFKNIFVTNPHQSPLLYLKGVKHAELHNIISFIYLGHCEVEEKELSTFLEVARELQVTGLIGEKGEHVGKVHHVDVANIKEENNYNVERHTSVADIEFSDGSNFGHAASCFDQHFFDNGLGPSDTKKKQKQNLSGRIYPCELCEYKCNKVSSLKKHKSAVHDKIKYKCDMCKCQASYHGLRYHMQTKHPRMRYDCEHCDYSTILNDDLQRHTINKHAGYFSAQNAALEAAQNDLLNEENVIST